MNTGALLIVGLTIIFLAVVYAMALLQRDESDIANQIIREHNEEVKRLRQKRYE